MGPAGVSHDDPESPNVHFGGPRPSKTPPKFNEKTPRESTKSVISGGEEEKKKSEILGGPADGCLAERVSGAGVPDRVSGGGLRGLVYGGGEDVKNENKHCAEIKKFEKREKSARKNETKQKRKNKNIFLLFFLFLFFFMNATFFKN